MPVVQRTSEGDIVMHPGEYEREEQLQKFLSQHPHMIMDQNEPKVEFVCREVNIPQVGRTDLLLIDEQGLPIVVEVKLNRNPEGRREVVGQVFDYVSALTMYTVNELNELVNGELKNAVERIADGDDEEFEKLWLSCGRYLRSGEVRVVVATDHAPEDLVRIIRFLNDKSYLDVRLVEIRQFRDADSASIIFTPSLLVHGGGVKEKKAGIGASERLMSVVEAYDRIAKKGFNTTGRAKGYRQIRPDHWEWELHYEFLHYSASGKIGVEIHLEKDNLKDLGPVIQKYVDKMKDESPLGKIRWDQKCFKGLGRFQAVFTEEVPAETVALAMNRLIELTYADIDNAYTELML